MDPLLTGFSSYLLSFRVHANYRLPTQFVGENCKSQFPGLWNIATTCPPSEATTWSVGMACVLCTASCSHSCQRCCTLLNGPARLQKRQFPCPAGGSHSNVLLFLSCCLFLLLSPVDTQQSIWIRKTKADSGLFSSSVVLMERSVFKQLTEAWAVAQW